MKKTYRANTNIKEFANHGNSDYKISSPIRKAIVQAKLVEDAMECFLIAFDYEEALKRADDPENGLVYRILTSQKIRSTHNEVFRRDLQFPGILKAVLKPISPRKINPQNCLDLLDRNIIIEYSICDQNTERYEVLDCFRGQKKFAEFEKLYYNVNKDKDKGQKLQK